jgi:hypothetical protein
MLAVIVPSLLVTAKALLVGVVALTFGGVIAALNMMRAGRRAAEREVEAQVQANYPHGHGLLQ